MRIFVVEPRGSGGMAHYAYQLCNALSQHASEVTLITAKNFELESYPHQFRLKKFLNLWGLTDKNFVRIPERKGFRWLWWKIYRNIRRVFRGARLFMEWIKLSIYLLKARPEIVQFGEIEFPFEAIFLQFLKFRGLLLAQICHEFEPRERADNFIVKVNNKLLQNVYSAFSAIFFHGQSNLNRFRELYPDIPEEYLHVIAMGNGQIFQETGNHTQVKNALMKRYGIRTENPVVLFFGNITISKGVPVLLRAFKEVYAQNSRARLVIAGMPLKYIDVHSLFATALELGIQSATIFDTRYLPMEEVGPLVDLSTVVVFPYLSSTQSASIQTAYALGKPVIASHVGGLPDVVVEGESGFLVEPNSPEQLSDAMMKILNDPVLAERMGCFARQLSETRFAWGPIAGDVFAVYRNIKAEIGLTHIEP